MEIVLIRINKKNINSDFNVAFTSETLNRSKSRMSNHEYLYEKFKVGNSESLTTTHNIL